MAFFFFPWITGETLLRAHVKAVQIGVLSRLVAMQTLDPLNKLAESSERSHALVCLPSEWIFSFCGQNVGFIGGCN